MSTTVMTEARTEIHVEEETLTSNDKPESAHIVMVPPDQDDETPQAYVMRARVEGLPITALCGFTWVPFRSAAGLPVCKECKDIFEHDPQGHGDRGDLPDE